MMMMKRILFIVCIFLGTLSFAQNYPMTSANNGQTFVTCSGNFTDDGGNSNYGNNITNRTITFCTANAGELLRFDFTSFNTEEDYDELEIFNGPTATGIPAVIYSGNIGAFTFISNQPGGCVTFRFNSDSGLTYSGWSANISCVAPCIAPTAAMTDSSTVDICSSGATNPGDLTVDFDASNSVSNDSFSITKYEWNWGDGTTTTTTTPITTHTFPDDPGIYTVTLKVRTGNTGTDPLGCLSSNTVVRLIRVLPPPNFEGTTEGPIDLSCGESVTLTGIASSQIITQEPPPNVGTEIQLPDGSGVSYYSYLDLTGYFPSGATINANCFPEFMIELEHSYAGDLEIDLIAPTGEIVRLFNGYGGSFGDEMFGWCVNNNDNLQPGCVAPYYIVNSGGINFGANAGYTNTTQSCDVWSNCYAGEYFLQGATFNSSQSMNSLIGAELNGVWILKITDNLAVDDGFIKTWSLSFPGDCYTDLETETPILSGGLWTDDGNGPPVPTPQTVTDVPFLPTTIDPCPGDADCTGNQLSNTVTVGPFDNEGTFTYTFTVTDEFGCEFEKEIVVNVECCSLELTSDLGTDDQAICIDNSIVDITYEAGGSVTNIIVAGLPTGVTWTFVGGILTITGTPTETGTFNYTVTTVGCDNEITVNGTITINPEPIVTPITEPIEFCTDSNTTYDFDLTQVEVDLVANPANYDFTYYLNPVDADVPQNEILVPTAHLVSATAPTIIYVRVEDSLTGCYVITEFTVQPGESVTLIALDDPIELCDENFDGTVEYDLTLLNAELITPTTGLTFSYYATLTDYNNDIEIPSGQWNNYSFTLPATILVVAEPADGCRSEYVEVDFVEGQTIPLLSGPYEIPICEVEPIDLTDFEGNYTIENDVDFSYYLTQANAESQTGAITGTTNYTPLGVGATIFVRLDKQDGSLCPEIIEIEFTQGQAIPLLSGPYEIPFCEGEPVDLTDFEGNYTIENDVDFSYYLTQANAETQTGAITGTTNYTPLGVGATIFVRLDKQNGSLCPEIIEIEFTQGQAIPLLTGPYEIPFCEGEPVDLTEFESNYTSETGVDFKYYPSLTNAENQTQEITDITNYNSSGADGSIFVRVEKLDGSLCPEIIEVEFIAGQEVQHNAGPYAPIEYCLDETIDITGYTSGMANESGVTISYYETLLDAQNESDPIPDETSFVPQGNGTVYIRLEKTDRCAVILELPYEQKPAPLIENIPDQDILCEGQETITLEAESDDPNATFEWSWGNSQTSSGATITITETGIYTVTAIGSNGCRSTQDVEIRPGGTPIIGSIESGSDYLVVFAQSGNGGTLEYSLNGVLWQTSPRFDGLVKGETYTVYVREDGCEVSKYTAVILDVPNFVSPNGDGLNDLWTIRGIEVTPAATIKIFDRYGKMFVDTNFDGGYIWDGKYGGRPVPTGDYWYILDVPTDGVILPQKFVGSISIRN